MTSSPSVPPATALAAGDPVTDLLKALRDAGVRLRVEDGGALRYTAPAGALTPDLKARLADHKPAVIALLSGADTAAGPAPETLPRAEPDPANCHAPFPLTDIQHAYWVGRSPDMELGNVATHAYVEIDADAGVTGAPLDLSRLEAAWNRLIAHHPMLRMVIRPDGTQQVLETVPAYRFAVEDLRALDPTALDARLAARADAMAEQTLSCEDWPLFDIRASLLPGGAVRLHVSLDFLMADTTSLSLLFDQWNRLYHAPNTPLPDAAITFRDYVLAERRLRDSQPYADARRYWTSRLDSLPPAPQLPLARDPATIDRPRFRGRTAILPAGIWARLKARARALGVTPSAVLLTAFADGLAAWAAAPSFTLNLTLFQRLPLHPDVDRLVGDFTSLTLLEVDSHSHPDFAARARALQARLWQDLDHRAMGGVEVMRALSRQRGGNRGAPMPVVFTSALGIGAGDAATEGTPDGPPLFGTPGDTRSQTPQVWIDHQASERNGALKTTWDAVEDLFPAGLLDALFDACTGWLARLAEEDEAWTAPTPCLTPAADIAVAARANATAVPLSSDILSSGTLPGLVRAQAARTPDAPAVIAPDRTLSYATLMAEAEAVAGALRADGMAAGDHVAICLPRGWRQAVAVLGTVLAGAAYVPVDPALPEARRHHLMRHARTRCALTAGDLSASLSWPDGVQVLDMETLDTAHATAAPPHEPGPEALAYILYTSGSTGEPKGVMISHRQAVNTLLDVNRRFGMDGRDRVMGLSALSFDLSVYDLFGTWAGGGALVTLPPDQAREPACWVDLLGRHGGTVWNTVPALMELLVEHVSAGGPGTDPAPGALRLVLLSGDWIPTTLPDRIRALWPGVAVISLGGATEGAIWSVFHPIESVDPAWVSIPYGLPLANQTMHVLGPDGDPRPLHVPGEIHIGGAGVALGYWDDPERTAAAFFVHPRTGERLYRTGDLGRRLPDGSLEFLGRTDFQVKINGHRVELGEIEAALESHPGIARAAVSAIGPARGSRRLVGHVALSDTTPGAPVEIDSIPPETATSGWNLALSAGRAAEREGLPAEDLRILTNARKVMEAMATRAMIRSLRALGLFTAAGERRTAAGIVASLTLVERHTKLLAQWLSALAEDGLLTRDGDGFVAPRPLPALPAETDEATDGMAAALARWPEMAPALGYFSGALAAHLPLLRGEADPLELLFPDGRTDQALAIYQLNPLAGYQTGIAARCLAAFIAARQPTPHNAGVPLRIVEIGAGIGGTTAGLLPVLPTEGVGYHFTDISPYFLDQARQRFAAFPFVTYGLLDITADPRHQGMGETDYDVVIASNVLHDAPHVVRALGHARRLLAPGGLMLVLESTRNSRLQSATVGFIEGFSAYDDARLATNLPLLPTTVWERALTDAGFTAVASLPGRQTAESVLDMHVIAGLAPAARPRFTAERLRAHLAARLPAHMVPAVLLPWDSLPLTANGKVDRQALTDAAERAAGGRGAPGQSRTPPATAMEKTVLGCWREVLGRGDLPVDRSFFEVGGDSLLATMLVSRLTAALGVPLTLRALFEAPTVQAQAALAATRETDAGQSANALPPLVPRPDPAADAPLGPAQRRLWFLDRLTGGANPFYTIPVALDLRGPLNRQALRQAVTALGERHPVLRARFIDLDGAPRLRLAGTPPATLDEEDLAVPDPVEAADRRCAAEAARPFDLGREAPFRALLLGLAGDHHRLLFTTHHIVSDGWTMALLARDVTALYDAAAHGTAPPPPPRIGYADYTTWQAQRLDRDRLAALTAHWNQALAGAPHTLALPTDRPRPKDQSHRGASHPVTLPTALSDRLRAVATRLATTPFCVLLALFQALMARLSGQDDLLIGSPIANRPLPALEDVAGLFANTLALRGTVADGDTVSTLITRTADRVLAAHEHQEMPFELLVDHLNPDRALDHMPLVQVAFALLNTPRDSFAPRDLAVSPAALDFTAVRFDLEVHMVDDGSGPIRGVWIYACDLFDSPTIARWAGHFACLATAALADPGALVATLPLMDAATRQAQLLPPTLTPADASPYPDTLVAAFAASVQAHAGREAVACGAERLTYAALEARARALAHDLRARGVGPGVPVAVALERGIGWPVVILGVLMAGGHYVPVDPDTPAERCAFIVRDCGAPVVVADATTEAAMAPVSPNLLRLDTLAPTEAPFSPAAIDAETPAYVIYTSGTTGRPKGVVVPHRAVLGLFSGCRRLFPFAADDVWSVFHSFAFDFSVWEVWGALLHGARMVIVPRETARAPEEMLTLIAAEGVTLLSQTPTAFRLLLTAEAGTGPARLSSLRHVVFGGEALAPADLAPWVARYGLDRPALINMYGITETTVHVTAHRLTRADMTAGLSPIGQPLPHLGLVLLDRQGQVVPPGIPGEIVVWGPGVAQGYLNRPDLTAARFVPLPEAVAGPPARTLAYRSGDLARRRADGGLDYLGRLDDQVNIHGFRVEPAEITAVLQDIPAVAGAVVVPRATTGGDGHPRLIAYAVPDATLCAPLLRLLTDPPRPVGDLVALPDGLAVYGVNPGETAFAHTEIFTRDSYGGAGDIVYPDGAVILDVGANVGLFGLFAASRCRAPVIHAFEPAPETAACLEANAILHSLTLRLHRLALGDQAGEATFTVYRNNTLRSGLHADAGQDRALLARTTAGQEHHETGLLDHLMEAEQITVPTARLSDVTRAEGLKRIDLLKIDAERAEEQVIDGIDPDHWPHIAQVVMEVHALGDRLPRLRTRLEGLGFRVHSQQDTAFAGTELHTLVAIRPDRPLTPGTAVPLPPSGPEAWARGLRETLAARLPAYMVPAAVVPLATLPLTANGKLDKAALPDPDHHHTVDGDNAPLSAREAVIAAVWADVLGVDAVGRHDTFFALGGDSILAILVVSRLARAGLSFRTRDLFEFQTVAALAAAAGPERTLVATQETLSGPAPATPIQHWFAALSLPSPGHFNQAMGYRLTAAVPTALLSEVLERVVRHHDALRATQAPDGSLILHPPEALPPVPMTEIPAGTPEAGVSAALARAQAGFVLTTGPLLHALVIREDRTPARGDRLVLIAHHLVVDTVSWWVILDDLNALLAALAANRPPALPPKTTAQSQWAARLAEAADGPPLAADRAYWQALADETGDAPTDTRPSSASTAAMAGHLIRILAPEPARVLAERVAPDWEATVGGILTAALACALCDTLGTEAARMDLEAHGRTALFDDMDLTRTVGWFTALYPVRLLPPPGGTDAADRLRACCAQLAAVPNSGLGFGVLRYLSRDPALRAALAALEPAPVRVNYLGRRDGATGSDGTVQPLTDPVPGCQAADTPLTHALDVLAVADGAGLRIDWVHDPARLTADTVARIADHTVALLEAAAGGSPRYLAELDAGELNTLGDLLDDLDDEETDAEDPFADILSRT